MAKINVEDLGLKKTMVPLAVLLIAGGAAKLSNWDDIVKEMQPKGDVSSGQPREVTILKDIEGIMLGRKCSITSAWFVADRFFKSGTVIKEADAAKNKLYSESKAMEKKAGELLVEARDITDANDKIAKFEEYDLKLEEAKEYRATPVEIDAKWMDGSFESIEALADSLKVEINPVKPEPEVTE
jgi:hypothetical protein